MDRSRHKTVIFTITLGFFLVTAKLFYWQVITHFQSSPRQSQNYQPSIIFPQVGNIYDSAGYPLALTQTSFQLSLYKPDLKTPLADLPGLLQSSDPQLLKFVNNPQQKWLTLKDSFTYDHQKKLTDPGFSFTPTISRYYPENELGQPLLRALEKYYQKSLSGRPGFIWENVDATGKTLLTKSSWSVDPIDGRQLYSSLNRQVQSLVEKTLISGIKTYSADSGSITILSPQSGTVLAMASFEASPTALTASNAPISHLFEPGSIFKPLFMAMALDSQVIGLDYTCPQCGSPHQIGQYSISNWDNSFHPQTNLYDIIKNSDNIGMSYLSDRLGVDRFLRYFELLSLNRKTGIDLSGEARPLTKNYWPEIDFATASFGQGFALTQIQMLSAFNVLANNGLWVSPRVAAHFTQDHRPIPLSRPPPTTVFKADTVSHIKKILKYGVDNGVVAKFKPDNLEVCGKSGTSQVAVVGGYSDSSTIASYIGFSPCDQPRFTMIVTINNPRTSPWGSSTAAPIWFELAKQLAILL